MLGVVGLIVGGVSLLLNVVGLAIPYWVYAGASGVSSHVGLWQACVSGLGSLDGCTSISDPADFVNATRAMEILGLLALAASVVCMLLKMTSMKDQQMLPKVAMAMAVVGGTFAIMGCIIFGVKANQLGVPDSNLHAGFALCIVAGVGAYVSGVLAFLSGKQSG